MYPRGFLQPWICVSTFCHPRDASTPTDSPAWPKAPEPATETQPGRETFPGGLDHLLLGPRTHEAVTKLTGTDALGSGEHEFYPWREPATGASFPTRLDDLIPEDHFCRWLDLFGKKLDMEEPGFLRAEPAETGRPGYASGAVILRPFGAEFVKST